MFCHLTNEKSRHLTYHGLRDMRLMPEIYGLIKAYPSKSAFPNERKMHSLNDTLCTPYAWHS